MKLANLSNFGISGSENGQDRCCEQANSPGVEPLGSMTTTQLSEAVGLSPTPIARRVRYLDDSGVIMGYAALIDEAALGYGVSVFVSVKLDKQVDDALEKFEAAITQFREVVDCWLMTGNRDYLLRIATNDLNEFERFLVGRSLRFPAVQKLFQGSRI